jgi:hypothetical protein
LLKRNFRQLSLSLSATALRQLCDSSATAVLEKSADNDEQI